MYRGLSYENEGLPYLKEYFDRKRLAEIGLTANLDKISYARVESFILISETFDKLRNEDIKKQNKKRGRK